MDEGTLKPTIGTGVEVGAGVGAQTEILLRHFPEIHVTGIEINDEQIDCSDRMVADV